MKSRNAFLAGLFAAALLVAGVAHSAGFLTNGLPSASSPLTGIETVPADTNLTGGLNPASEAVTVGQLAQYVNAPAALTAGTAVAVSGTSTNLFTLSLASSSTLSNPTNMQSGQVFRVLVTQAGGGSHTLGYGTAFKFAGGTKPTISVTNGAVDMLTFVYNGTSAYAQAAVQNLQ